ncbi:MAG: UDP-N-acetylglucosamine 2-epimerase [Infirmifilum sp.]
MSYLTFLATLKASKAVITDSGGVQEEAFVLGKPTITLRKTTEWSETVITGYNILLDPDKLDGLEIHEIIQHIESKRAPPRLEDSPIGDGQASKRITKVLLDVVNENIKFQSLKISPLMEKPYYIPHLTYKGFISFDPQTGLPVENSSVSISRCPHTKQRNVRKIHLYKLV